MIASFAVACAFVLSLASCAGKSPAPTAATQPAHACPESAAESASHAATLSIGYRRQGCRLAHGSFSPDGRLLATSCSGGVLVGQADRLRPLRWLSGYSFIAWNGPTRVLLRDESVKSAHALIDLEIHGGQRVRERSLPLQALDASSSTRLTPIRAPGRARWLSVRSWSSARFLYDDELQELGKLLIPDGADVSYSSHLPAAVSGSGSVYALAVTQRQKGALVVWSFADSIARPQIVPAGLDHVSAISLDHGGLWALVAANSPAGRVRLVPLDRRSAPVELLLPPASGHIYGVSLSPDGKLAAAATKNALAVWSVPTRSLRWVRRARDDAPQGSWWTDRFDTVAVSPNGKVVAASGSTGSLHLFEAETGRYRGDAGEAARTAEQAAWIDDDHVAVRSTEQLGVWSLEEPRLSRTERLGGVGTRSLFVTGPRGTQLLTVDSGSCGQDRWTIHSRGVSEARSVERSAPPLACLPRSSREIDPQSGAAYEIAPEVVDADPASGRVLLRQWLRSSYGPQGSRFAVLDVASGVTTVLPGPYSGVSDPAGRLRKEAVHALLCRPDLMAPGAIVAMWNLSDPGDASLFDLAREHSPDALRDSMCVGAFDRGKTAAIAIGSVLDVRELPGGRRLRRIELGVTATALAFASSGDIVVGGADGSLSIVRGKRVVARGRHPGAGVREVAISPNGARALTVGYDGAVRVWDARAAALLATLAQFEDDEWIVATPGGAYAGTDEVSDRVGFVFDRPLERFGFGQFAQAFRRNDIVRRRLDGEPIDVPARVPRPPSVTITRVAAGSSGTANIEARAESTRQIEVVRAFADGRLVAERRVCAREAHVNLQVPLLPGPNRIAVVAFDSAGRASNPALADANGARGQRPDMWVVAIGVSRYPKLGREAQLELADDDARGIAAMLFTLAPNHYSNVHARILLDAAATPRAIRDALAGLSAMRSDDVAVIFFAGHGVRIQDEMVFLTSSAGRPTATVPGAVREHSISWADVAVALARAQGRVLVLLDACHSGHMTRELVVPNDALARELSHGGRGGVVVFAAAKGRQPSLEPTGARGLVLEPASRALVGADAPSRHGYFTGAVLRALRDRAADVNNDGWIQVSEIVDDVTRRVARASHGRQTPWVARKELFGDFRVAPVTEAR